MSFFQEKEMYKKIIILILIMFFNCRVYGGSIKTAKFYSKALKKEVEVAEGEMLVKFKSGVNRNKVSALAVSRKCSVLKELKMPGIYKIKVPQDKTIEEMIEIYKADPEVEYAEPNYIRRAFLPNDTNFNLQWGLHNTGQPVGSPPGAGTVDIDIDAPDAWTIETGGSEIIIAILDSGVDIDHPDLVDNLMDNDPSTDDDYGHGTHVAGIAAGKGNNGTGITGVCWDCNIMSIKVIDQNGEGTSADIIDGIKDAANDEADVINLSLGGAGGGEAEQAAVDYAFSRGCVIVASMGNVDAQQINYPAACNNVIAVGAINKFGVRCSTTDWGTPEEPTMGSTYGSYIDLVAPGDDIYSCTYDGDYGYMSGTSMACPFVAGACALLLSWDNNKTPSEIMQILGETAVDVTTGKASEGWDIYTGSGTINVHEALIKISEDFAKVNKVKIGNNFFNPTTGGSSRIWYYVKGTAGVTIKVYNLMGEELITLLDNVSTSPGRYSIDWLGVNMLGQYVGSGMYFVKMKVGSEVSVGRVMVIK